jgi:GxxExxY protein
MEKDELTYRIIGCAMKVHNTMGPGFQEVIYQRCLALELARSGLAFHREKEQTVYYEKIEVGTRRADFVVEEKVIIEIKALVKLEDVHIAQAKNYTVAYDFPLGLLINFGGKSLEYKLLFNPKFYPVPNSVNSDSDMLSNPNPQKNAPQITP